MIDEVISCTDKKINTIICCDDLFIIEIDFCNINKSFQHLWASTMCTNNSTFLNIIYSFQNK